MLELYENVDIAFLTVPGKRLYLHRMPSASGVTYSDGNTTLWIKGQNASIKIEGQTESKNCSVKPKSGLSLRHSSTNISNLNAFPEVKTKW